MQAETLRIGLKAGLVALLLVVGVARAALLTGETATSSDRGLAPACADPVVTGLQTAWELGLSRFRGECKPANFGEALVQFRFAAQAGHACALGAWGLMLVRGWGTPRNPAQGRELLLRSAEMGCVRAGYWAWLGDSFSAQARTQALAMQRLEQGAAQGDGHAINALGTVRERSGQPEDARRLYERASAVGNTTARQNLARLQRQAARSANRTSPSVLISRAQQGDAQSQYLLARRWHQGDGMAVDYGQALAWYRRAAVQSHPAAREMLNLIQARLGQGESRNRPMLAELALLELPSDELNKPRGVTQPIEDEDPFLGL